MISSVRKGVADPEEKEDAHLITHRKSEDEVTDGGSGEVLEDVLLQNSNFPSVRSVNSETEQPQLHVYRRRWWVLAIFSLSAFLQAFVYITFSAISISAKEVFDWTDSTIALLVDYGNLPFLGLVIPFIWLLDVKGLRVSTLLAGLLMTVGTSVRCISSKTSVATPLIHVGQLLNGIAGIIYTGAPAQLSALWFPAHQRTTATSLSILTNYLGVAFGYLAGPYLVPNPNVTICDNTTSYNESLPCTNRSDIIEKERTQIMYLMYYESGVSLVLFLAAIVYFPERPPLPPSPSATQERLKITSTLLQLLKNRNFWVISMGFSITCAVAGNWLSVLGPALQPFNVTQEQVGLMGMASIMVGAPLSLVLARIVDHLGGKIKLCLIVILIFGCASFVWYTLLYYKVVPFSLGALYPPVIMAGIVAYTGSPLYMEMCVEAAYPIQEGVVGTVLQTCKNFVGAIFLAVFLFPDIGVSWTNWTLISITVVAIVLACLQSETYHRSDVDRTLRTDYQPINSDVGPEDP